MKAFLSKITFARFMIGACLVGSVVLAVFIVRFQKKIEANKEALRPEGSAAKLVREIQAASKRYTTLYETKGDEKLLAQDNPQEYISIVAADPNVKVGRVDIKVSERGITETVTDRIYSVTPFKQSRDDAVFRREQIANFLWKLENDSRRVRITDLTMTAVDSQGRPLRDVDAYPEDLWSFSCKLTSRTRKGESSP